MRSLKELARQEGVTGIISLRGLMNRFRTNSLKQLFAVHDIREKYRQLGEFNSPLGLAINENLDAQNDPIITSDGRGGFVSNFRGGRINLASPGGSPPIAQIIDKMKIWFVGLECRVRQESKDEIFGSVGIIIPSTKFTKTIDFPEGTEYWTLGEDGSRTISLQQLIYDGVPADVVLNCVLIEHDSGDIDEYKKKIAEALAEAAKAGLALLGVPAEATAADQGFISDISLGLVNVMSGWVGADDDPYTPQALRIPARNVLIALAQKFEGKRLDEPDPFPERVLERSDTPGVKLIYNTNPVIVSGTDQGGDRGEYGFYFKVEVYQISETS